MGVTQDLVAALKANADLKQRVLQAKTEDKWMRMAEMYFANGEKAKGLALLARMEEGTSMMARPPADDVPPSSIDVLDASSEMYSAIEVMDTNAPAARQEKSNNKKGSEDDNSSSNSS